MTLVPSGHPAKVQFLPDHHQHHRRFGPHPAGAAHLGRGAPSPPPHPGLLDLPARLESFIQAQQEFNQAQREFNQVQQKANEAQEETNRLTDRRLNAIEGQLGNLQGGQYERFVRTRALARLRITLGFTGSYVALNQDGLTDPRMTSAIAQAIRAGLVTRESSADLFEADMIISGEDNRHAVVEVSFTADRDDIDRAKTRASIMACPSPAGPSPRWSSRRG